VAIQRRATGGDSTGPIAALVVYLVSAGDGGSLSEKLLAAQHDDWQELAGLGDTMANSDWLTLRRIDPTTLGRLPPQHRAQS
jgi:hypothetical protein